MKLVLSLWQSLQKKNPDITIETETLHANEVVKSLLDDSVDIGLVFDAPSFPGIQKQTIGESGFVCVAPKDMDLPSGHSVAIDSLRNLPLITLNQKSVLGKILAHRLEDAFKGSVDSNIVVETYHLAKRLVKQDAGIAIIDAVTALSGDSSGLQIRKISPSINIKVDVITRIKEPKTKLRSEFIEELKAVIQSFCSQRSYKDLIN